MTLKEAYKILGASKTDDDSEIKAKYKRLLFLYHPDSAPGKERNPEDDEKIRQVIEAYRKIRESEGETFIEKYEFSWDAFENSKAFSERNIYVQFRIYDEALPLSKMARGRFIWDPDMEEFSLFSKSVLESCKEVMTEYQVVPDPERVKNIFHLMMQEYVLPADAARKIGNKLRDDGKNEVFQFTGFISDEASNSRAAAVNTDTPLNIYLREDRAVAEEMVSGRILGNVSFDEDALYYVILPLLEDPEIEVSAAITGIDKIRRGKTWIHVAISLAIPRGLTDKPVVNGELIKGLLK
ncbi:DnaJ domain-containing protein [Butyrivibrio sp. ob235]|uniref:J domain-containing protein n=1 Tax=Butyrivibrio sp. ob235 TaxID=1761780 RepID=UPI0008B14E7E|nr:J domain-containing protein [Butyrivibrio sp. ob235]SEL85580.1 DnaJ domain-containing protein [Butyrivibrio sp. ob235]